MLVRNVPPLGARCRRLLLLLRSWSSAATYSSSTPAGAKVTPSQLPHVTAPLFAGLLKKVGLSQRKVHALYANEGDHSGPYETFPIAVAFSGGADSMALTLLLRQYLQQQRIRTPLLAITVDHRLRVESTEEAEGIGRIVTDKWGVEHVIAQCEWAQEEEDDGVNVSLQSSPSSFMHRVPVKPRGSKLQEEARRYRYALLQQVCREKNVKYLFVAHNLGDQLETMLFRLGRASGINGLAGIAKVSTLGSDVAVGDENNGGDEDQDSAESEVKLVRPLLSITKPQLKATCRRFQQEWVEDPSNEKLLFDRIRIRKELERLEAERGPKVLELFSKFQQHAAKAKNEFARAERRILRKYVVKGETDHVILQMAFLDDDLMFEELSVRVVSKIIQAIGNKDTPPRLASVLRLVAELKRLESGKTLTLSGCRITKKFKGKHVHFEPERKRQLCAQ
uniref:tRNA(Ile)-lysidine synthetase n=1 Tax=Globisporangium ultimum (strain ATCC 200006 / CBS 805.95 / DAOM BR144) TaxID=431595 RepID=K3WQ30_GLOUD